MGLPWVFEMSVEFNYQEMMQEALLHGVVRGTLRKVAETGLTGEHHFYIVIRTDYPGTQLSEELKDEYPEEIVIVLQHRFWNLKVEDDYFEVDLTFNDVPQRLVVPFKAVKGFFDPSVEFGLQFDVQSLPNSENAAKDVADNLPTPSNAAATGDHVEHAQPGGQVVSLDAFRKS